MSSVIAILQKSFVPMRVNGFNTVRTCRIDKCKRNEHFSMDQYFQNFEKLEKGFLY